MEEDFFPKSQSWERFARPGIKMLHMHKSMSQSLQQASFFDAMMSHNTGKNDSNEHIIIHQVDPFKFC